MRNCTKVQLCIGLFFCSGFCIKGFFFILDVFHNVADIAMQDFTEGFDGVGADTFVSLQARDLPRADMIILNQCVLRNPSLPHDIPQIIK